MQGNDKILGARLCKTTKGKAFYLRSILITANNACYIPTLTLYSFFKRRAASAGNAVNQKTVCEKRYPPWTSYEEGATGRDRNRQIGGHKEN